MNRKQRRALPSELAKARKAQRAKANITEAMVVAFRTGMDGPQSVTADVKCACGSIFRVPGIESPDFGRDMTKTGDEEQASATTGKWRVGGCPACGRAHRLRATMVVIVEEEDEPMVKLPKSGLILPR